jgi:hypothetical protein
VDKVTCNLERMLKELNHKIDSISPKACTRLERLQQACSLVAESHSGEIYMVLNRLTIIFDRKPKIVIFVVCENRDALNWRSKMADIFVTGHSIDVADVYRLGRFNSSASRPHRI